MVPAALTVVLSLIAFTVGWSVPPHKRQSSGPIVQSSIPPTWVSIGCWSDSPNSRALHDFLGSIDNLTEELCIQSCEESSEGPFSLAGVEFGGECYCGNAIEGENDIIESTSCNMACIGDSNEICGGAGAINLFLNIADPSLTAGPPSLVNGFGEWVFQSCTPDSVSERVLPNLQSQLDHERLTIQVCLNTCQAAGFTVAGLEDAQECWCGNVDLPLPSVDVSNCDQQCTDDANEFCGGSPFLQIYALPSAPGFVTTP